MLATSKPVASTMNQVATPSVTQSLNASSTPEEKITNAMSAAPETVAKDATVLDWPTVAGKDFVELRKGTSEWTCLPDDLTTPSNDPICVDGMAMKWFQAYMGHKTPKIAQAGVGYMLQGGGTASNTDPSATKPADGETWMKEPPHIMIFPTSPADPKVYGSNPDSGGPWVMWPNTPYAHLMVPVK